MSHQKQILIVDDEESILRMLVDMAEILGFDAVGVTGVNQALVELDASSFDLVISDVVMPGRSGVDLLRELQRTRPELPVVMIAAFETLKATARLTEAGAAGFLAKPFQLKEVETLLSDLLGTPRLLDEG